MNSFTNEIHADEIAAVEPTAQDCAEYVDDYADEYDGQPDEYTEWQDYMGGDDWDHGQYDE